MSLIEVCVLVDNEVVKMVFEVVFENVFGNVWIVLEYVMFIWKILGDIDVVEMLYNKVLELVLYDVDI